MIEISLPEKLGELVTENQDQIQIEQLTHDALTVLSEASIDGLFKGTINHAYVISLTFYPDTEKEVKDIHILGTYEASSYSYITSKIVAVNDDCNLVQTQSGSLYKIHDFIDQEIETEWIVYLCGFLNRWGLGRQFGLPQIYF